MYVSIQELRALALFTRALFIRAFLLGPCTRTLLCVQVVYYLSKGSIPYNVHSTTLFTHFIYCGVLTTEGETLRVTESSNNKQHHHRVTLPVTVQS
jgi:hypothetical protein